MSDSLPTPSSSRKIIQNSLLRSFVFGFGWFSVVLGVIGIFLPVMPTTPFLLLAAACFLRTSPKFYQWLVKHPKLGRFIVYYLDGKGMPVRAKIYILILLWFSICFTSFVVLDHPIVRIVLPTIGVLVSVYILRQPTLELVKSEDELPK